MKAFTMVVFMLCQNQNINNPKCTDVGQKQKHIRTQAILEFYKRDVLECDENFKNCLGPYEGCEMVLEDGTKKISFFACESYSRELE